MKRRIQWSVTGQRNRGQWGWEVFCAVGFGATADEAIADALKSDPDSKSWRPEELIAKPDRIHLPAVSSLVASVVFLAAVCVACGGQSPSPSPDVFHDTAGLSAGQAEPSTRGVGNSIAPAVGGKPVSLRAVAAATLHVPREETGLMASVHGRRSSDAFQGVEQSALSDQSGGMPDTGPEAHSSRARNLMSVAGRGEGATAVSTERRGELIRSDVTAGETAISLDRDLLTGLLTTGAAIFVLVGAGCFLTRYPDRRDEEEAARRVRDINNILEGPL